MKRTLIMMGLAGAFSLLPAQSPRSAQTPQTPGVQHAAGLSTMSGVLMDASCSALQSRDSAHGASAGSRTADPATERVPHSGVTGAAQQSTVGEVARTRTEVERRAEQANAPQTGAATDRPDRSPEGGAAIRPGYGDRQTSAIGSATAGPSYASATGTTGAAVQTAPPPQSGNLQSMNQVQGPGAPTSDVASATGERARTRDTSVATHENAMPDHHADKVMGTRERSRSGEYTTVREKYRDCMVKSSTTRFALHTEGELYMLDEASNNMIMEQMRNEAFRASMTDSSGDPKWISVTVTGKPAGGDMLSLSSVRR